MIRQGRPWLDTRAWDYIAERLLLSPREAQVIQGLMNDQTERAIACELRISVHTVHSYRVRVYQKLAVSSGIDLAGLIYQTYCDLAADMSHPLPPICERHRRGRCPLQR